MALALEVSSEAEMECKVVVQHGGQAVLEQMHKAVEKALEPGWRSLPRHSHFEFGS